MASEKTLPHNIVDILVTQQSEKSFSQRLLSLGLSADLEEKCLAADLTLQTAGLSQRQYYLTSDDEKELATEVLLCRHNFTQMLASSQAFRQAALSVIQNIYLSKDRRIFFDRDNMSPEQERQAALTLFGSPELKPRIPLGKTLQHSILARIWHRIVYTMDAALHEQEAFLELHEVVERLNTLRNIYILLTTGLVGKMTSRINALYRQSVSREDAVQIGSFGIARAAYRYHHAGGGRFSTFASFWVMREVQRHALGGRLIRIPATLVEELSRVSRQNNRSREEQISRQLHIATMPLGTDQDATIQAGAHLEEDVERRELHRQLFSAIDTVLSAKSADIIKRRYGLGEYTGGEQSVISIAREYGVTRGSIYQLEQAALNKLKKHLISQSAMELSVKR